VAQPASVLNFQGKQVDTVWGEDGVARVKVAIGGVPGIFTPDLAWQGIATHAIGQAFSGTRQVGVVGLGVDGTTVRQVIVDSSGRQLVVVNPNAGSLTDASGTITTGGTSQEVLNAEPARKLLIIQNLDDTEDLWINFGGDATIDGAGSIVLGARQYWEPPPGFMPTQSVEVNAASTGHKFTVKEA
jgi:hypothetical protein